VDDFCEGCKEGRGYALRTEDGDGRPEKGRPHAKAQKRIMEEGSGKAV